MSEGSLNRVEEHLTQLIHMVAENNRLVKGLEERFNGLEGRFDRFEEHFEIEKELNRQRHVEIIKEIRNIHFEIDYLREQSSKHDMAIHTLSLKQT